MDRGLQQLEEELASVLSPLSAGDTRRAPQDHPEKWTIQQIAEHLELTYTSTCRVLRSRIDRGRPTKARPGPAQILLRVLLFRVGFFPKGRKAPPEVCPPTQSVEARTGQELATRLRERLLEIDELTAKGEELFGSAPAVSHSVFGPLTMQQWRRFHLLHGRHHLKQINALVGRGAA